MNKSEKIPTRRKFVLGLGIISLFGALGIKFPSRKTIIACAPSHEKKTVKMLTQDGRLVEMDIQHVKTKGKKISNDELKSWVKKS
jgi:hypothetical protein